MKKMILLFSLSIAILNANLINAVALTVNNKPITLSDIDNKMINSKMKKKDAIDTLISEILYNQIITQKNIYIDTLDINNYIEQLAKQNNMKIYEFKNAIRQQQNYELFTNNIKKQLKHQKLILSIANGKISQASDDDLKIYYNNHEYEFKRATKIDLRVYLSKDKKALQSIKQNPMLLAKNVEIQDITLQDKDLTSKIRYIISNTPQKRFSSIFINNQAYNMLYVVKKYDIQTISFEDAKVKIFEIVMKKRQDEFLNDYFETLKLKANIKVLR
jgi:hypothetical protein